MFVYDPQDPNNCIMIKPFGAPDLEIIIVLDKDGNEITSSEKLDIKEKNTYLLGGEEYTYVSSTKSNEYKKLKWCFWIEGKDGEFSKSYFEIEETKLKKEGSNFFLTGESCEANTQQLEENAILYAHVTKEKHIIDGKEKEVEVLKIRFSKWLDAEKINVELYKYNTEEKKGEPTGNSNSKDSFPFSAQKTVKSIYLAARPTAWKVKNKWSKSYVKGFNAFAEQEFKRIVAKADADGKPNRLNSFNCSGLYVTLLARYSASNNLPLSFGSVRIGGYRLDASDSTYKKAGKWKDAARTAREYNDVFYSNDPEEAIEEFVETARNHVTAEGLIDKGDLLPIATKDINEDLYGAVYDDKVHMRIVLEVFSETYSYVNATFLPLNDSRRKFGNDIFMKEESHRKKGKRPLKAEKGGGWKGDWSAFYIPKEMYDFYLDIDILELKQKVPKPFNIQPLEPKKPIIKNN